MLISTKGRYALRLMADLAAHASEGYVPLKEAAQRQEISEKYLEAIAKILVKAKLLNGIRGKGGGYKLALAPEQVTVGEVLRLTEDSLSPVACLEEDADLCPRAGDCLTLPLWKGLAQVINEYLDHITLADLLKGAVPVLSGR